VSSLEFLGSHNSISKAPLFDVKVRAIVKIKKMRFAHSTSFGGQLFKVWAHATITAESVEVIECKFRGTEVLRIASDGVIEVRHFHMKDTECHQAIHASWVGNNYKGTGTIAIHSASIIGNTAVSVLVGIQDTASFRFTNAIVKRNKAINLFVTSNSKVTLYQNLTITENVVDKCFELKQCNVDVDKVDIYNNKINGYGKALYYEKITAKDKTTTDNFTINIRNFRAAMVNHALYDPKKPVISIDITDSTLNLKNVEIDIGDMPYPLVKGVYLSFKTKNKKVNPALNILCPRNYNPSHVDKLGVEMFSYTIDCLPCPRGLYSVERGSEDILYIDNENIDTVTWKDNRIYLHRSPPVIRECKECPPGGNCTDHSIKSLGNYYGRLLDKQIEFVPCPNSYCCSNLGQPCVNYTSCNYNRRGTLCGTCDHGYYESYFSPKCISNDKCSPGNQERFWVIFIATALILTIAICSTKDFAIVCVCLLNYIRSKLSKFVQKMTRRKTSLAEEIDLSWFVYKNKVITNSCIVQPVHTKRKFIFSTVFQIVLSFFQIASLISLKSGKTKNTTLTRVVNLFNLQIAVKEAEELCPSPYFTVIWKHFTKNVLFVVTMLLFLTIPAVCSRFYGFMRSRCCNHDLFSHNLNVIHELKKVSLIDRLVVGFVKILMFGYKNISLFTIVSFLVKCNATKNGNGL